ncbi:unnamed protein product [Cylicocyclus nassatus]|uniref:MYST-type HAT domain-containing protein n=1 Tax=Cylicocyclus nassatus TaxID=53992 RepID=A0AA36GKA4_CYLNA|nr:unnamed protein product [Cylicocyclus nassatus]
MKCISTSIRATPSTRGLMSMVGHSEDALTRIRNIEMIELGKKCYLKHPPGNEIYRNENFSFFEIDGSLRSEPVFAGKVILITRLCTTTQILFSFYVLALLNDRGFHIIGFFSKEKESAEEYNVACILVLPPYQKMGYGRLLIEFRTNTVLSGSDDSAEEGDVEIRRTD